MPPMRKGTKKSVKTMWSVGTDHLERGGGGGGGGGTDLRVGYMLGSTSSNSQSFPGTRGWVLDERGGGHTALTIPK